jgi:hypothetical protein
VAEIVAVGDRVVLTPVREVIIERLGDEIVLVVADVFLAPQHGLQLRLGKAPRAR